MRLLAALLPAVLLSAPLLAVQQPTAPARAEDEKKPYEVGSLVDETIQLTDIDGKVHKLSDYRGKTVVLDFWSYKCPYNKAYEQRFQELVKAFSAKGVAFLAIDSCHPDWDDTAEDPYAGIKEFRKESALNYPILIDRGNVIADRFGAMTTPHIYVLDAKGYVRFTGAIDNNADSRKPLPPEEVKPYLATALDELLAGKPVTTATSKPVGCSIKRVKVKG